MMPLIRHVPFARTTYDEDPKKQKEMQQIN